MVFCRRCLLIALFFWDFRWLGCARLSASRSRFFSARLRPGTTRTWTKRKSDGIRLSYQHFFDRSIRRLPGVRSWSRLSNRYLRFLLRLLFGNVFCRIEVVDDDTETKHNRLFTTTEYSIVFFFRQAIDNGMLFNCFFFFFFFNEATVRQLRAQMKFKSSVPFKFSFVCHKRFN